MKLKGDIPIYVMISDFEKILEVERNISYKTWKLLKHSMDYKSEPMNTLWLHNENLMGLFIE